MNHNHMSGAIVGGIVGDALGVPVEFMNRNRLDKDPVKNMRSHGTHGQVKGTWSDDSSLCLVTMDVLSQNGYHTIKLLEGFSEWMRAGAWTAHGNVFDIGNATSVALQAFHSGSMNPGCSGEHSNGNGSLMRMMPLSIWYAHHDTDVIIKQAMACSSLTHAHIRSQLVCAYHALLVSHLIAGNTLIASMQLVSSQLTPIIPDDERAVLEPLLSCSILHNERHDIQSSGYVVHCMEASLWCLHQHDNFSDTVLAAVNLGDDTDTTACVCGGLAGLIYGSESIPPEWIDALARKNDIQKITHTFLNAKK